MTISPNRPDHPPYANCCSRPARALHTIPDLPYGLEVWHGAKMLSVLWTDDGSFEVVSFVRGPWEEQVLAR